MKIGVYEASNEGHPYIVAEVGSNWASFDECITSIQAAAKAGANAVKFQAFTHESLYGFKRTKASGYNEAYELSIDWIPRLKAMADQCRIDFMCTAFDPQFVRVIDPMVHAHKVASSDLNHEELLLELNRMGKPVFLSTGSATETEIKMACALLQAVPVVVMYCVASYPARTVDLTIIDKLRLYSQWVGFSDHTLDPIYLPYAAHRFHKVTVIEKHFNAGRALSPDSGHSLNPSDFTLMVDRLRGKREGHIGATPEEQDMVLRHKRRLVAVSDIKKGDLLKLGDNFGPFRSLVIDTKALNPWHANDVNGRGATRDIKTGDGIGAGDFQ